MADTVDIGFWFIFEAIRAFKILNVEVER